MRHGFLAVGLLAAGLPVRASAQDVRRPADTWEPPGSVVVVPAQPGPDPVLTDPAASPPPQATSHGPFRWLSEWRANRRFGCWTSYPEAGCGNFRSDLIFVFGSCRTFYREPCLQGPTPVPLPPGYLLPDGRLGTLSKPIPAATPSGILGAAGGCGCP